MANNNWAIAVGIDRYEFLPDASLQFAAQDALAMQKFLCEEAKFETDKVLLCGDGSGGSRKATRSMLRHILLNDLQRAQNADNLWFFFSGHGWIGTDKQDYLMTIDGNPDDLEGTAVSIHFVTDRLRACQAKNIVLILDMCRIESRDAGSKGVESIEASLRQLVKEREGQKGIITLFSCGRGENSYEIAELGQGAFTYALLEGLRKHTILKDLENYLARRVPELHRSSGKARRQVPLVIPEPGWKYEEPILSHYATGEDVRRLKEMAIDAWSDRDIGKAIHLWEQVNLLATDAADRRRALNQIRDLTAQQLASSQATNPPPSPASTPSTPTPQPEQKPTPPTTPANLSHQIYSFETAKIEIVGGKVNIREQTKQAEYITEDLENGVKLEMVYIPPGSFLMGQTEAEKRELIKQVGQEKYQEWFAYELPQHLVKVPGFYMGKYPITQSQYLAIVGKNPSKFQGENLSLELPVEQVSWNDAKAFCEKLRKKSGKPYRLPSEAEWEYACRAGSDTPFHFGETITTDIANFDGNYTYGNAPKGKYLEKTTPVGSYQVANDFGLYDLHGNVWEWCEDTWHENYQGAPEDGTAWIDNDNHSHLLRGGSWLSNPRYCRSAFRDSRSADLRSNYIGFRVVFPQNS